MPSGEEVQWDFTSLLGDYLCRKGLGSSGFTKREFGGGIKRIPVCRVPDRRAVATCCSQFLSSTQKGMCYLQPGGGQRV